VRCLARMIKVFLVCILIICFCETCVSLVGKSLVPVTGLTKLSSFIPFGSDVCSGVYDRKLKSLIHRSRSLKLALCRVSDTEVVSPENLYTTSREETSLEKTDYIPSGYKDSSVLLVGDGDFSFAAALSSLKICRR
jgi:hypothetical protein